MSVEDVGGTVVVAPTAESMLRLTTFRQNVRLRIGPDAVEVTDHKGNPYRWPRASVDAEHGVAAVIRLIFNLRGGARSAFGLANGRNEVVCHLGGEGWDELDFRRACDESGLPYLDVGDQPVLHRHQPYPDAKDVVNIHPGFFG